MDQSRIADLPGALKAGAIIASMFGLKGIERTSSINNFAYQITGINTLEMLGFSSSESKTSSQTKTNQLQVLVDQ